MLAAVLLSPEALPQVAGHLSADDFYVERHRLVYQAMLELYDAGVEVDLRTLQARLEQTGVFAGIGGMAFLASLDLDLPSLAGVDAYVDIVKERSIRRQMKTGLSVVAEDCADGRGVTAVEALTRAETLVLDLGGQTRRRTLTGLDKVLEETLGLLEARNSGESLGVASGFPDWDRLSEGLVGGNLIVLAGRPGMGKTSFALDVARHVAISKSLPVALFSLEMSQAELGQRILSAESDLPFSDVRASRLAEQDWMKLYRATRDIASAPLYIDDSASPSVLEIAAKARRIKARHGLALVVVDYLQLIEGPRRHGYENRQQEVAALSRSFKRLAKDLEIPVLLLSQLSRKPEERVKNHRPVLADLRESGAIEQDADMVCFVYREELYSKDDAGVKGLAELIVEKNRNGPTGTVELVFLGEQASFRSRTCLNPPF